MGTSGPRSVFNLLDHLPWLYIHPWAELVGGQRQKWSKCCKGRLGLVCLVLLLSLSSAKWRHCLARAGTGTAVASRQGLPRQEATLRLVSTWQWAAPVGPSCSGSTQPQAFRHPAGTGGRASLPHLVRKAVPPEQQPWEDPDGPPGAAPGHAERVLRCTSPNKGPQGLHCPSGSALVRSPPSQGLHLTPTQTALCPRRHLLGRRPARRRGPRGWRCSQGTRPVACPRHGHHRASCYHGNGACCKWQGDVGRARPGRGERGWGTPKRGHRTPPGLWWWGR